jgi:nitrogen-specific signal transduction histidine kinase
LQIIVDRFEIIQTERPKTRQTTIVHVLCDSRLIILQIVEFKELRITQSWMKTSIYRPESIVPN